MDFIYFLATIFGFFYFLMVRRYFDFLTVGFISQQIYFSPCLVDFFLKNDVYYLYSINNGVFITGIILILSFVLCSIKLYENCTMAKSHLDLGFKYHALFSTLLAVISFIISIYQAGPILFNSAKAEVLNSIDRFYILWSISALYGLAVSTLFNQKKYIYINIFLILITIYIGFRSIAAIAVISALVIFFVNQNEKVNLLLDHYKKIVLGFLFGVFFLVYKGIYIAVKFQNYDTVFEKIKSKDFYLEVLFNAEPFGIQRIFSDVLQYDFFIGLENLNRFIFLFTLFSNDLGIDTRSFNDYFQPALYGDVGYGMGSNVWAHMYSSGGWILLIIFILLYSISLRWLSKKIYFSSVYYKPVFIVIGAYWSFYIHRNDLFYQLGLEKRVIIIFLIVSFFSWSLNQIKMAYVKR